MWNVFVLEHGKSTSSRSVKSIKIIIKIGHTSHAITSCVLIFTNGSVFSKKTSGAVKPRDYCQQTRFLLFFPDSLHSLLCIVRGNRDPGLLAGYLALALWVEVMVVGATGNLGSQLRPSTCRMQLHIFAFLWVESLCIDYLEFKIGVFTQSKSSPTKNETALEKGNFSLFLVLLVLKTFIV